MYNRGTMDARMRQAVILLAREAGCSPIQRAALVAFLEARDGRTRCELPPLVEQAAVTCRLSETATRIALGQAFAKCAALLDDCDRAARDFQRALVAGVENRASHDIREDVPPSKPRERFQGFRMVSPSDGRIEQTLAASLRLVAEARRPVLVRTVGDA